MFTGIVTAQATLLSVDDQNSGLQVTVERPSELGDALVIGESIAHAGICLTVTRVEPSRYDVFVGAETLRVTTATRWHAGTVVNVERALRASDRLGGHVVSGHVDGVATLVRRRDAGGNLELEFAVPDDLSRFLIVKGSVTLDGVSLTVNVVTGDRFGVALIPHTQTVTTLGSLVVGDVANLEVDAMAKTVDRFVQHYMGRAQELK